MDEYRDRTLIAGLTKKIRARAGRFYTFMEVCGGHTMAIHKFGLPWLLPSTIRLKSGPGCPVCVTDQSYVDRAVAYAEMEEVVVCTYGDLLRVPGTSASLYDKRGEGCDVRVVYSLLEALRIAREESSRMVVFLGIGFETTAPGSAVGILEAEQEGLDNFCLLSAHKRMPPAMEAVASDAGQLDGFICPGHVSTITGMGIYEDLPRLYGMGCVISGFEPTDMLESILLLVEQMEAGRPEVAIQYKRAVRPEGNLKARALMDQVFQHGDDTWRGLGVLPDSGLRIRPEYARYDAEQRIPVEVGPARENAGCICGEILKGQKEPSECPLFATSCTPVHPVGACMVSSEGACQAYYKYRRYA